MHPTQSLYWCWGSIAHKQYCIKKQLFWQVFILPCCDYNDEARQVLLVFQRTNIKKRRQSRRRFSYYNSMIKRFAGYQPTTNHHYLTLVLTYSRFQ
jgi:hypothetical protein